MEALIGLRCSSRELVSAPAVEPVTAAELKSQLRVDYTDQDTLIGALITVARETVEEWTNRALITQTWKAWYQGFDDYLIVPKPKVSSLTHIKYYSTAGVATTVAASVYEADLINEPALITTAYGQVWPTWTSRPTKPVEVQFVAGYGAAAANVPGPIKQAIIMLAAHWFRHPEAVVVGTTAQVATAITDIGAHRLLDNYTVKGCEL
jgi:uncharacterized phiE125 gp8 family phage protein